MKRSSVLALAFALLWLAGGLSLTPSALARSPGPGHDRLTRLEEKIDGLDLDDTTRTALHTTIEKARDDLSTIRGQLRNAYKGLRTLMRQEPLDEKAVLAQADVIGPLEAQRQKLMLQTLVAVQTQLTPEQRASLREAMPHHGAWKQDQGR
jgi:Spy/CpxP family protein refolding chaperone